MWAVWGEESEGMLSVFQDEAWVFVTPQDCFSWSAEFGLAGGDDFHLKAIADGTAGKEALQIGRAKSMARFPRGIASRRKGPVCCAIPDVAGAKDMEPGRGAEWRYLFGLRAGQCGGAGVEHQKLPRAKRCAWAIRTWPISIT